MLLYEKKIEYNMTPLLKNAIEISSMHFVDPKFNHAHATEKMVTIGLGRQCGHSSSIRGILLSDETMKQNSIVLCHNQGMANEYIKLGIKAKSIGSITNRGQELLSMIQGRRNLGIIFDSCSALQVSTTLMDVLSPYSINMKFIVNVAPHFS